RQTQHAKALEILEKNRQKLDEIAMYLYEKETITGEEFMEILQRPIAITDTRTQDDYGQPMQEEPMAGGQEV
ncbi:MAG: hypothetical protein LUH07_05545, partial [Lachnospiraceae bacterium]|nr:hypothetical protein [Lachnospiraceae bacterium]